MFDDGCNNECFDETDVGLAYECEDISEMYGTFKISDSEMPLYIKRAQEGDEMARNAVIYHMRGFVMKSAKKFAAIAPDMYEDFLQAGYMSVNDAIDKYDFSNSNAKFSTFAYTKIALDIKREYRNNGHPIRIPVGVQEEYSKVRAIEQKYISEFGCQPSDAYIARQLGAKKNAEYVKTLREFFDTVVSLDSPIEDGEGNAICRIDNIADTSVYHSNESEKDIIREMSKRCVGLEKRVLLAVTGYDDNFNKIDEGTGKNIYALSKKINVSYSQTQNIFEKVSKKVRAVAEERYAA